MLEETTAPRGGERLHLLLVEDNPGDAALVREHLHEGGAPPRLRISETLDEALDILRGRQVDAVLLDLNLPDSRGLETLDAVLEAAGRPPVVVLTGLGDAELGAVAVRRGAQDFLPKDEVTGPLLHRTIRHARERHRHQEEARAARTRAQRYLEVAEVILVALDRDGRITMVNPAGAGLLERDAPSALEGASWFEVAVPPRDRERTRELHRALLTGDEELTHYETPIVTRSGAERMIAWKTSVVRDEDGRPMGTLSSGLDITERRASKHQVQLLTEALQSAHNAIVVTDRRATIEWVNPAFTTMTGYAPSEAVGHTVGELLRSGEHDEAFYRDLWETVTAGRVWEGRIVNRRKDGTLYPEEQTITPVRDASGEIAHFIAVKRDVSERVEAEEEVRRVGRALRVISGGNQALVRSSGEEEILEEVCRVAVDVGGYVFTWIGYLDEGEPGRIRPVAHRGEGGDEYLADIDLSLAGRGGTAGPIGTAVRTGAPSVVRTLARDGDPGSWEVEALERGYRSTVAIPLVTEDRCLGALSIYSDEPDAFDESEIEVLSELGEDLAHGIATHRTRRRKEELEDHLRQAEKLRAVGQLAGGVAHDFNNYLTVITTLTDVILEDPGLSEESRGELREVQEAAESSARLTRQLLAFSRQQVAALEVVDLGEQVREMGSMLERLLEETIRVELRLEEGALPVRADPGRLEQVMMNLTVNARDAMPEGGALLIEAGTAELANPRDLGLEELEPGPYVFLAVEDTGSGIPEDHLSHIFEPFFTDKDEGTGLGLSTVYGIVRQCGGGIRVESEPGDGTRFEIHLPRCDEDELGAGSGNRGPPGSTRGTETVLVVEDQPSVRGAVRRVLERSGYEVLEAENLTAARAVADDPGVPIQLVLTDLGLPDGSGREVGKAFRTEGSGPVVIYMSGYTPDELEDALELGPHERFIEKPFDLEKLVRAVRAALDAASGRTAGEA